MVFCCGASRSCGAGRIRGASPTRGTCSKGAETATLLRILRRSLECRATKARYAQHCCTGARQAEAAREERARQAKAARQAEAARQKPPGGSCQTTDKCLTLGVFPREG